MTRALLVTRETDAFRDAAEVQARGGIVAWIDKPHSLDISAARRAGIDPAALLVSQPDTADQLRDVVQALHACGVVELLIVVSP